MAGAKNDAADRDRPDSKTIGRELQTGARPSESAWAAGPMLADAGATKEIAACLFAEARRKRPSDRLIHGCAFMLERALDALRLRANGGDVGAGRAIEEVRKGIEQTLVKDGAAPEVLIMIARAFALAELDPGEALQEAVEAAMEAQSAAMPPGQEPADIGDQFDDLAASFGDDPFAIYANLAATAAAFPAEHRAAMASALAMSNRAAVREAVLGFACEADPTTSTAALMALAQPPRGRPVSSTMVERLVRMRPWLAETRRASLDAAVRVLRRRPRHPSRFRGRRSAASWHPCATGPGHKACSRLSNGGGASRWPRCWSRWRAASRMPGLPTT